MAQANVPTRGYKTTEFWSKLVFQVGVVVAAIGQVLPARYAAIAAGSAEVAFIISRGLVKGGWTIA